MVPGTYLYYLEEIASSPLNEIFIDSGPPSASNTIISDTSPFSDNIAGVNNSVYVTVKDAFDQIINHDTSNFTMTNLSGGITTIATYQSNGIYKITYMGTVKTQNGSSGNFTIKLNGNDIIGSPFDIIISPASTSPLNSSVTGSGLISGNAGERAIFTLIVYDEYNNERETGSDTISVRFYGASAGNGVCEYYLLGYGIYNCSYTLTIAGTYYIEIMVNDIDISSDLSSIIISEGIIHGPSCTITSDDTSLISGNIEVIYIQARDQFSNALTSSNDNFIVTIPSNTTDINATATVIAGGNGGYYAQFTPTLSGIYSISIKLNDTQHIDGSPYSITVTHGNVYPSNCIIYSGTGHSSAQVGIETYFIIQTKDEYNNDLTNNFGSFSTSQLDCTSTVSVICSYIDNGRHNCTYTPIQSGSCTLTMQISSTDIYGSSFSVTIIPGIINADTTSVSGISNGTVGDIFTFTIHAKDVHSNNLTSGGETFLVNIKDSNNIGTTISGTVTDHLDGTYGVEYECTLANTYDYINVKLFSIGGLLGNYYTDYYMTNVYTTSGENVVTPTIDFDWGYGIPLDGFTSSDYFSITWNGRIKPPYSETYTFYTPLNAGSGVKLWIDNTLIIDQWTPYDGETDPYARVSLTKDTQYIITLHFREKTGESKIKLEWESASISREVIPSEYLYYIKDVGGSESIETISIIPTYTNAAQTVITGDGLTTAVVGDTMTLSITAKDQYGNIQTDQGNEESSFFIQLIDTTSSITVNGTVMDSGNLGNDGLYTGTYNVTNATDYTLYITFNGIPIDNSPYSITATPTTISGTTSSASIPNGRAGELQTFYLYVRDIYGNLCECGGQNNAVDITVSLTHSDGNTIFYASSIIEQNGGSGNGVGIFTIQYTATKSGIYTPSIIVNNINIISITSSITMSSPLAKASLSYVNGWSNGISNTLSSGIYINKTIQLIDIYNYNIEDSSGYYLYSKLVKDNTEISRPTIYNQSNGEYNITFIMPTSGVYYLYIQLASGDLNIPDGLTGYYYNNRWLYGTPIDTKIDSNLSISFGTGLVTSTAKDYVSIQWTGFILPKYAETYTFKIISDDGSRLYIDNTLIFDNFLDNAGTFTGTHTFSISNILYPIKVEWRDNTDTASIQLKWSSASLSEEDIPQSSLFASATDIKESPFTIVAT